VFYGARRAMVLGVSYVQLHRRVVCSMVLDVLWCYGARRAIWC